MLFLMDLGGLAPGDSLPLAGVDGGGAGAGAKARPGSGTLDPERYRQLLEAEAKYRALVEQIPAITYTEVEDPASPTGFRDVYTSPQTMDILGYSPEEWAADPELWITTTHPDDREGVLQEESRSAGTGDTFHSEYRMIARDGRVVWFRDEAILVTDPTTGDTFWHGVMLDITEEKKALAQTREAELRWRTLVETLPAVVFIDAMDDLATNIYTSPQTAAMLGYTPEDWQADPDLWWKLIHQADRDRIRAAHVSQVEGESQYDQEYRMVRKDGRTIWVRDVAVVVEDGTGEPLFSQGFLFDVTDRKDAERALQDALEREHESAERLRALDEMKNTLLHAISHDLRGPLTTMLGSAATLARKDLELSEEDREGLLQAILGSTRKMERLLVDLLDLERIDRGILSPARHPEDVGELVTRLVTDSDVLAGRSVEVDAEEVVVAVDAAQVERIVENLLANAVRYTPADTQLWVAVRAQPGGVLILVEDEGPGVPDDLKGTVFEPFRRGEAAWRRTPGTGVGLSLVSGFAELHGGRAWVEDREGGGASFRVFLPEVGDAAATEPDPPPAAATG